MSNKVDHELKYATRESSRSKARMEELKAIVLGGADLQTRLAAQMQIDVLDWKRRASAQDRTDDTPQRITFAKRKAEASRLAKTRARRISAGLVVRRPRRGRPSGTMAAGERVDGFAASDNRCIVCGRGHDRIRSQTCSPKCGRAVRAARRLLAQPASALITPPPLP